MLKNIMAAKVTPYFILTAEGMSPQPQSIEVSLPLAESQDSQKPSISRSCNFRTSKNIKTLTRNEHTRKRMDIIRQNLEDCRSRHAERLVTSYDGRGIPRIGDEMVPHTYNMPESHESKMRREIKEREVELVSLSNNKCIDINKQAVPYVYFVVSMDRTSQSSHTFTDSADEQFFKEFRQNNRTSISKVQKGREERRKTQQKIANEIGIRTDIDSMSSSKQVPQKHITFPDTYKLNCSPPRNPPATPATLGSAYLHDKQDTDNYSFGYKSNKSIADIGDFTSYLDSRPSTKNMSTRIIELPNISAEQQRKNLGTVVGPDLKCMDFVPKGMSSDLNRKVHFSDSFGLPIIQGNGIVFSGEISIPTEIMPISRSSTIPALMSKADLEVKEEERNESQKLSKLSTTSKGRKKAMPLSLPKIDIVSGVYDELIINAITSYVQEFPGSSRQSQIARHLLCQLKERTLTAADLTHKNDSDEIKPGKQSKLAVKELPNEEISRGFPDHSGGKTSRPITRRSTKAREREFSTIAPKCFKMAPPGKTKEEVSAKLK